MLSILKALLSVGSHVFNSSLSLILKVFFKSAIYLDCSLAIFLLARPPILLDPVTEALLTE